MVAPPRRRRAEGFMASLPVNRSLRDGMMENEERSAVGAEDLVEIRLAAGGNWARNVTGDCWRAAYEFQENLFPIAFSGINGNIAVLWLRSKQEFAFF